MQSLQQRMDDWKQRVRILMNQILTVDQYYVTSDEYKFTGQASYADIAAGRTSPSSRGCSPYRNQRDEPPPSCPLPIQILPYNVTQLSEQKAIEVKHVEDVQPKLAQIQMQTDDSNSDNENSIRSVQQEEQTPKVEEEGTVTDSTLNSLPVITVVESIPRRGRSPIRKSTSARPNMQTNKKYENPRSPVSCATEKQILRSKNVKNTLIPCDDNRGRSASPIWVPGSTSYADILRGGTHATFNTSDSMDNDINSLTKETHNTHSNATESNSINLTLSETHINETHTIESESIKPLESSMSIDDKQLYEQSQETVIEKDDTKNFSQETSNTWSSESLEHCDVLEEKHYDNIESQVPTTETYEYIHQPMTELVGFIGSQLGAYPVGSYVYAPVELHQQIQLDTITPQHYSQMGGYTTNHYVGQNNFLPTTSICHESHIQQQRECPTNESENSKNAKIINSQSSSVLEVSNLEISSFPISNITEQTESKNEQNVSLNTINMDNSTNSDNIEKKNTSVSNNTENKSQIFSYAQILSQGLNSRTESASIDRSTTEQIRGRSGSPKIASLQYDLPMTQPTINPQEEENVEKIQSKQSRGNDWDTMKKKDTKKKPQSRSMEKSKYTQDKRISISTEKAKEVFEREITPSKEIIRSQNLPTVSAQKTNGARKEDKVENKQQKKKTGHAKQKQDQQKEKVNQQQKEKQDHQKEKLDQQKEKHDLQMEKQYQPKEKQKHLKEKQEQQKEKQEQRKEKEEQQKENQDQPKVRTPETTGATKGPLEKKRKQKKKKSDKTIDDEIDKALKEIEDMDKQKAKKVELSSEEINLKSESELIESNKSKEDVKSKKKNKVDSPKQTKENIHDFKTTDIKPIDKKSEQLSQYHNESWKMNKSISSTIEAYTEKLKAIKKNHKVNVQNIEEVLENITSKNDDKIEEAKPENKLKCSDDSNIERKKETVPIPSKVKQKEKLKDKTVTEKLVSTYVVESKEQPIEKSITQCIISLDETNTASSLEIVEETEQDRTEVNSKEMTIIQDAKVKSTKKISKTSKIKDMPSPKKIVEQKEPLPSFEEEIISKDKKQTEEKILSEAPASPKDQDKFNMEPLCKDETRPNLTIEEIIQVSTINEDNINSKLIQADVECPKVEETEEFVEEKGDQRKEEVEHINHSNDLELLSVNSDISENIEAKLKENNVKSIDNGLKSSVPRSPSPLQVGKALIIEETVTTVTTTVDTGTMQIKPLDVKPVKKIEILENVPLVKTVGSKSFDVISLRPETVEASLITTYARVPGNSYISVAEQDSSYQISHTVNQSPIVPISSEIIESDEPPLFGSIKDRRKYREEICVSNDSMKETLHESQMISFGDDESTSIQTVIDKDLKKKNSESLNSTIIDDVYNSIEFENEKEISEEHSKIEEKNELVSLHQRRKQTVIDENQFVKKEKAKEKVVKERDDDNKTKHVFDTHSNLDQRESNEYLLELIKPYWLNYHNYTNAENELCRHYKIVQLSQKPRIADIPSVCSEDNIVKIVQESVMKKSQVQKISNDEKAANEKSKIISLLADVPKYPIISFYEFESQWIQFQQAVTKKSISSSSIDSADIIIPVNTISSKTEIIEKDVNATLTKINEIIDMHESPVKTKNDDIDANTNKNQSKLDCNLTQLNSTQAIHLKTDDSWMSFLDETMVINDDNWEEDTNEMKQNPSTIVQSELDLIISTTSSMLDEEKSFNKEPFIKEEEEGKVSPIKTQISISSEPKEKDIFVKYEEKTQPNKDKIHVSQRETQNVIEQKSVHLKSSEDWLNFLDEEIPINSDDFEDLEVKSNVVNRTEN
ncbi:myb-like protein X [Vespa crabro]|uniref:myb-like protein X n=1 Tax=Vespa crabro TaxID=7445 RepID=UPI001F00FA80|nr:myb-like protein X [Vespa crabro]